MPTILARKEKYYNIINRQRQLTTPAMRLIELRYNRPIKDLLEEYLATHSLAEAQSEFGVDFSTISKWKRRLGIKDYPKCEVCPKESFKCVGDGCEILKEASEGIKKIKSGELEKMSGTTKDFKIYNYKGDYT